MTLCLETLVVVLNVVESAGIVTPTVSPARTDPQVSGTCRTARDLI